MEVINKVQECLDTKAREISARSFFSYLDALSALHRCYDHFTDAGKGPASACDMALEMVERALLAAPRYGFALRPMVDHMLFSELHRVPSRIDFIR